MNDIITDAYEVGTIINENRKIIYIGYNLDAAKIAYYTEIEKAKKSNNHVIVFLYDYDKNTNIEYYDSEVEIC